MIYKLSFIVTTVAALILFTTAAPSLNEPVSPCPRLFEYKNVGDSGIWTGNLILTSDDDLHGVWIRLFFDAPPQEVTAEGFETVLTGSEVLVKNKEILLTSGSSKTVNITVKYDADKFPRLTTYRLNAKTVCPGRNTLDANFFKGDENEKDFLSTVLSKVKPTALKPAFKCGLKIRESLYPWHTAVFVKGSYICEGTLISPSHVLLPAHCVTYKYGDDKIPESYLTVTFTESQDTYAVVEVKIHDGYNYHTLADDLAVLKLSSPVRETDFVKPICLDDKDIDESTSILVGNTEPDFDLEESAVKMIDANECAFRRPNLFGVLNDNNFCVSYLSGSHCVRYSGSSIVSVKDKVATLRGILTVGPTLQNPSKKQICNEDTTAIAVDVTKYHKWLLRAIS